MLFDSDLTNVESASFSSEIRNYFNFDFVICRELIYHFNIFLILLPSIFEIIFLGFCFEIIEHSGFRTWEAAQSGEHIGKSHFSHHTLCISFIVFGPI